MITESTNDPLRFIGILPVVGFVPPTFKAYDAVKAKEDVCEYEELIS